MSLFQNIKTQYDLQNFYYAALNGDRSDIKKFLEKYGDALIDQQSVSGIKGWLPALLGGLPLPLMDRTALMLAADRGDVKTMAFLLENGADINAKNRQGMTALMVAALSGERRAVKFLLENGASVHEKDRKGRTALEWAQMDEDEEDWKVVKRLKKAAALQSAAPNSSIAINSKEISYVENYPAPGEKVTKTFDFEKRQYTVTIERNKNSTKDVTQPFSFDNLPSEVIQKALADFIQQGGKADEKFVLYGKASLDKLNLPIAEESKLNTDNSLSAAFSKAAKLEFRVNLSLLEKTSFITDATFASTIDKAVNSFGIEESKFRQAFTLSKSTVNRWIQQQNLPQPEVRPKILRWIRDNLP